ncbi:MAG TPA: tRNA (N6-threonylcarbamoyladenosine(37)-N6)-methyltransferase TrmO [Candidatus Wallbacteria bacterium]|nr:tRNA (N6-threonylcarbamoyladenosine(37)-N6)-methyltransferase TrmO [Candidatus Wallbacteria bacterium]
MKKAYSFEPIGFVKRPGAELEADWSDLSSDSVICVDPRYRDALDGLLEFSHILVFFVFDRREGTALKIRPEEREDMPEVGIFCTNSFMRPAPLGVTMVKITSIEGTEITVNGLDALDGTPVIDIKPYCGFYYETKDYKIPAWLEKLWAE